MVRLRIALVIGRTLGTRSCVINDQNSEAALARKRWVELGISRIIGSNAYDSSFSKREHLPAWRSADHFNVGIDEISRGGSCIGDDGAIITGCLPGTAVVGVSSLGGVVHVDGALQIGLGAIDDHDGKGTLIAPFANIGSTSNRCDTNGEG